MAQEKNFELSTTTDGIFSWKRRNDMTYSYLK